MERSRLWRRRKPAFPQHRLDYIKENLDHAEEWVGNLLFDTPYEADILEVKKALENNLKKIEQEKSKSRT